MIITAEKRKILELYFSNGSDNLELCDMLSTSIDTTLSNIFIEFGYDKLYGKYTMWGYRNINRLLITPESISIYNFHIKENLPSSKNIYNVHIIECENVPVNLPSVSDCKHLEISKCKNITLYPLKITKVVKIINSENINLKFNEGLIELRYNDCNIKTTHNLPESLVILSIHNSNLETLPDILPSNLKKLYIIDTNLKNYPNFNSILNNNKRLAIRIGGYEED